LFEDIDWWWVLPTHVLTCLAYIFVYPVGLALFSRAAPAAARATYIGIFFLTSFVASNLVGFTGGYYATMSPAGFWAIHGCIGLGGALLALVVGRPLAHVLHDHQEPSDADGQSR
jgi:POT family proton-dependent oligopeptide transporter